MIYAATIKKEIVIYYKKDNSVEYSLKTDSWFPITMAMQLTNVKLIEM